MQRPSHILNAASNLLGIALVIIAGLNVTHVAATSFADEIAWFAAICFATSCLLSYMSIRDELGGALTELWADRIFLIGLFTMIGAMAVLAIFQR